MLGATSPIWSRQLRTAVFAGAAFVGMGLLGVATAPLAHAQSSDSALAEALFKDGRDLMEKGALDEACPKFEESQRLAPKLGTLLNLATCHDKSGRTASAWDEYTRALSMAKQAGETERVEYARAQLEELEPRLSKVAVEVPSPVGDIVVKLDGTPIGEAAWGTPVPLDPGAHELEATAPGFADWSAPFEVPAGPHRMSVEVPKLDRQTSTAGAAAPDVGAPPDDSDEGSTQSVLGWTVGAAGLVGVGVGVGFGISAFSTYGASEDHCASDVCNQEGLDLRDDAKTSATVSNIAIGVGAGAMLVGLVLVLTSGGSDDEGATGSALWLRPSVSPSDSLLHAGATF